MVKVWGYTRVALKTLIALILIPPTVVAVILCGAVVIIPPVFWLLWGLLFCGFGVLGLAIDFLALLLSVIERKPGLHAEPVSLSMFGVAGQAFNDVASSAEGAMHTVDQGATAVGAVWGWCLDW